MGKEAVPVVLLRTGSQVQFGRPGVGEDDPGLLVELVGVRPDVEVAVGPLGVGRDAWNHGCWSLVWFATKSMITGCPGRGRRRGRPGSRRDRPDLGEDAGVVRHVVPPSAAAREERRDPEANRPEPLGGSPASRQAAKSPVLSALASRNERTRTRRRPRSGTTRVSCGRPVTMGRPRWPPHRHRPLHAEHVGGFVERSSRTWLCHQFQSLPVSSSWTTNEPSNPGPARAGSREPGARWSSRACRSTLTTTITVSRGAGRHRGLGRPARSSSVQWMARSRSCCSAGCARRISLSRVSGARVAPTVRRRPGRGCGPGTSGVEVLLAARTPATCSNSSNPVTPQLGDPHRGEHRPDLERRRSAVLQERGGCRGVDEEVRRIRCAGLVRHLAGVLLELSRLSLRQVKYGVLWWKPIAPRACIIGRAS